MAQYLGLDIGTTTITALLLDTDAREVGTVRTVPNSCEITSSTDRGRGRSEWNADAMVELCHRLIRETASSGASVAGIGVTGQMHGMLLVSAKGDPLGPFIGWQDQRGTEAMGDDGISYVERMGALADRLGASERGCRPRSGYLGTTLFWMATSQGLPPGPFTTCFLPDFIVATLTGIRPMTDPTNAAGSGLFDAVTQRWEDPLIEALGLSAKWFPEIRPSGSLAGGLKGAVASETGLPQGLPVFVACGDNQASFAGSVGEYGETLLINVGTGGQVSVYVDNHFQTHRLETRPYMDGRYLLVGGGLVGGRTYAWLRNVFREIGMEMFGGREDEDLYDTMNRLAAAVPPGSDGLRCEPLLTGTRTEPHRRGTWSGINPSNFTPGHMARSLLEGIVEQFRLMYVEIEDLGAGNRSKLVGAGNGIRKNPLLQEILPVVFDMPLTVPTHAEEAAFGAALLAAVGDGTFKDLQEAGKALILTMAL